MSLRLVGKLRASSFSFLRLKIVIRSLFFSRCFCFPFLLFRGILFPISLSFLFLLFAYFADTSELYKFTFYPGLCTRNFRLVPPNRAQISQQNKHLI